MGNMTDTKLYTTFLSDAFMLQNASFPYQSVKPSFALSKNLDVAYPFGMPFTD